MLVFRLESGYNLWRSYSADGGMSWAAPSEMEFAWAVWPQLLQMSSGALLLSSGRPGIGLWISRNGDPDGEWEFHNIAKIHNSYFPPGSPQAKVAFPNATASVISHGSSDAVPAPTTAYTSLVELEPGVAYLSYDRLRVGCPEGKTEKWCQQQHLGYDGGRDYIFAMRIHVPAP